MPQKQKTSGLKITPPENTKIVEESSLPTGNSISKKKKTIIGIVIGLVVAVFGLTISYIGIANTYSDKFLPNTKIQSVDVSGKTLQEANVIVSEGFKSFSTTIKENGQDDIILTGEELKLKAATGEIEKLLNSQNQWDWLSATFSAPKDNFIGVQYDDQDVLNVLNSLDCLNIMTRKAPVNATVKFDEVKQSFVPVEPIYGNLADRDKLTVALSKSITNGGGDINIEDYYIQPHLQVNSPEISEIVDNANRIINKQITYNIDMIDNAVILTKEQIISFVMMNDESKLIANEENIKTWLKEIGKVYDTTGIERRYITAYGKEAVLPGGSYGWITDEAAMLPVVIDNLFSESNAIDQDFKYQQECNMPKDAIGFGDKYIDLDITEQKVRLVQNNQVINEFDCVTGTDTPARRTTLGAWKIYFMATDFLMISEEKDKNGKPIYETPSKYFAGFHSGQGFHDADWRYNWRKNAWKYDGSHGCANMHGRDVKVVYEFAEMNMPVLVHM